MVDSVSLMCCRLVGYQRGSCEFSLAWDILFCLPGLSGGKHGGLLSYHAVQTSAELTTESHGVPGSLLLLLPLCHTFLLHLSKTGGLEC